MSQPDLVSRLGEAHPVAPPELRERVRLIAAEASVPPRRILSWRRAAVVLITIAVAIAAAIVVVSHGGNLTARQGAPPPVAIQNTAAGAKAQARGADHFAVPSSSIPAPSASRAQRYSASLELRVRSARAVSDATKRASAIIASLGGYPASLSVNAAGTTGYADLVLRVPRIHVQEAVRRLSALGTIVSENVAIQDLQAQVNATAGLIARLQRQLAALRAGPQTTQTKSTIGALTARVERLQRGQAATLHAAHYATVELRLTTQAPPVTPLRHGHGPLHGLGVAFHWLWIGAVYALALGAPFAALVAAALLLARALRRRREDSLLRRS